MSDSAPKMTDTELQEAITQALLDIGNAQQANFIMEFVKNGGKVYEAGLAARYCEKTKDPVKRKLHIQQQYGKILKKESVEKARRLLIQQVNRECVWDVNEWLKENIEFYRECRELVPSKVVATLDESGKVQEKMLMDHRNGVAAG